MAAKARWDVWMPIVFLPLSHELPINSLALLKRLGINPDTPDAPNIADNNRAIKQKFSWGPEIYSGILIVLTAFLAAADGVEKNLPVLAVLLACFALLLGIRLFQRVRGREIIITSSRDPGRNPLYVEIRSRFHARRAINHRAIVFQFMNAGNVILAGILWGCAGLFAAFVFFPMTSLPAARVSLPVLAVLCAAHVLNLYRTNVLLHRCALPIGNEQSLSWIYISRQDAKRLASASLFYNR
jgi:hypothetical protein